MTEDLYELGGWSGGDGDDHSSYAEGGCTCSCHGAFQQPAALTARIPAHSPLLPASRDWHQDDADDGHHHVGHHDVGHQVEY